MGNFNEIWAQKPKREGGNPRPRAERAYNARIKEKVSHETMLKGVMRYHKYCEDKKMIGSPYVLQMATFLGPEYHFENDWKVYISEEDEFRGKSIEEGLNDTSWAEEPINNMQEVPRLEH